MARKPFVQVMYRVWRVDETLNARDYGSSSPESARDYGSFSPESAAQAHAAFCHRHRAGDGWSWPITFLVLNQITGKLYEVEVKRDLVPEFSSSLAKPVSVWGGQ